MKKKNAGFTLVEMLVVLAIMGLILIMAFPAVNQLIKRNQNKKYIYHEQAMIEAAKLYLDQYEADIVGKGWYGCFEITYQQLLDSKLLKSFQEENIECNISGNKVRITKQNKNKNKKSSYQAYLQCKDIKNSNKVVYKSNKAITGICTPTVPSSSKSISNVLFDPERIGSNCWINKTSSSKSLKGDCSNNYVWYSGKLWRVISHNSNNSNNNGVRMITQWNMTTIPYGPVNNSVYDDSYAKEWIDSSRKDGFKGTLRERPKFLVDPNTLDSLSKDEYTNFMKNGLNSGLKTAYDNQNFDYLSNSSSSNPLGYFNSSAINMGIRPVVTIKGNINIATGNGTQDNPYRLSGDNDKPSAGTLLNTRYSGEYVNFNDELYRIIYSPLVENTNTYVTKIIKLDYLPGARPFDSNSSNKFSVTSTSNIGYYLNTTWKNTLSSTSKSMLAKGPWYLGPVGFGENFSQTYRSCTGSCPVNAEIGLPAVGELLSGQFNSSDQSKHYWTITPVTGTTNKVNEIYSFGKGTDTYASTNSNIYIRPALYLNSTVKISSGTGTPNDPFILTQ